MNWQRKARLGIAVFVLLFMALVAVALRQRKPARPQVEPPQRVDQEAVVENVGTGTYTHTKDGKVVFTMKFGSQFTYQDGRSKFGRGVQLTSDRDGRPFVVTSQEAELVMKDNALQAAHLMGDVKLTSNALEVSTGDATYNEGDGVVRIPGPVTFTRGRMKGSGVGATYDLNREVLWLLDKAQISVSADAKGEGALEATSTAAGLARADHYIKLTGNGHIVGGGQVIDATEITINLTEDEQRVEVVQLRGSSRISGTGSSAPRTMSARDIDLTYAEDGRTLQRAQLMENSVVQLPGSAGAPGRNISGKTIDIAMAPDGATVTNLTAVDNVQVDLPAAGDEPAKRIRSATLNAVGAPGTGLQNATFSGNVEYRETRAARRNLPAVDRTAKALRLVVETQPGLGAIRKADFFGNVHFTDGAQIIADSSHALYVIERGEIDLSPSADPGPPTPRITDGRVTVEARAINFALGSRKLKADTKVRSSMLPGKKTAAQQPGVAPPVPPAGAKEGKLPTILKQDETVTVTSNRLEYDGDAGHAKYTGNSRLWQGDTSVRGDVIIVDDKSGNLEAQVNVRTEMWLDDVNSKTGERRRTRTTGEAQTFLYDDARRLATYTDKAHMVGAEGDVTADKLELFLLKDANELERAEGYGANGNVTVKEGGRTATGARLTYTAKTETYLMTGTPVIAIDRTPPDCQRSEGATLTFQRAIDTLSMAGNGVIRNRQDKIDCTAGPGSGWPR